MNRDRRRKIGRIIKALETTIQNCEDIYNNLDETRDEEEEALDAMPDNLRETERAQVCEEAIDALETAVDMVASAQEKLEEAKEVLEEIS